MRMTWKSSVPSVSVGPDRLECRACCLAWQSGGRAVLHEQEQGDCAERRVIRCSRSLSPGVIGIGHGSLKFLLYILSRERKIIIQIGR